MNATLGGLTLLSLILLLWQWLAAWRFPLHRRVRTPSYSPGVTLLKPLKGCDPSTEACLRSWFTQDYPGPVQILFGVAS
ncbi:MAG TPA: glycosyl transferase, partial [Verrucomicrobiae bacterium]